MSNETKYIKYGKLLSGLIHNLNTPLMGLSGRVELLQMKFEDEKSFNQINTQLDKINAMLSTAAYLLDKDQTEQDLEIDFKVFIEKYFNFLTTDMRYKHQTEKELNFESCNIITNVSDLLNIIHNTVDYLLQFIEGDTTISVSNILIENGTELTINIQTGVEISPDFDYEKYLNDIMDDSVLKKYPVTCLKDGNKVNVKMIILSG
ncbi:MAG: hypothetical protein FWG98_13760 [Candidatus Cloacimonetes bacterium]|nr:hypothetical protein [Candidatus Cloacimonadota bacterium]